MPKTPNADWLAHRHCAVCGPANKRGLALRFFLRPDGVAEAHTRMTSALQGYGGIVQGGVTAALLDSAMVNSIYKGAGVEAVTVEMTVRYLAEVPIGALLRVEGSVLKARHGLYWTQAHLYCGTQEMASAEAKFMQRR